MASISVSNLMDLHVNVANLVVVDHPLELCQFGRELVVPYSKNVSSDGHFIAPGIVAKDDFIVPQDQGIL